MPKRKPAHTSPKTQVRAIRQAITDTGLDADQPIRDLLDAVERRVLEQVLGVADVPPSG